MNGHRSIFANGMFAAVQVLWTTVVLFVVYRIATQRAGIEILGLWSSAIAVGAVAALADFGLMDLMVRQVAELRGSGRIDRAVALYRTLRKFSALTVAAAVAAIAPLTIWWLSPAAPPSLQAHIALLVGAASLTVWMNSLSVGLFGVLEAFGRYDLKFWANVGGGAVTLATAVLLVPLHPAFGIAATFMVGPAIGIVIALRANAKLLQAEASKSAPAETARIEWHEMRAMLKMGIQVRLAGIFLLGLEPVTRFLLVRFGGLEAVGLYELAYRAIFQLRSVIVSALQVLVPGLAAMRDQNPERAKALISQATYQAIIVGLPAFALAVCMVPLLSLAMLGRLEWSLAQFAFLLAVAWAVNMVAAPAYFANLVEGQVRSNWLAHLSICTVNLAAGLLLGTYFGALGVVGATALAILTGSCVTLMSRRFAALRPQFTLTITDWGFLLAGVACVAAVYGWWTSTETMQSVAAVAGMLLASYGLAISIRVGRGLLKRTAPHSAAAI